MSMNKRMMQSTGMAMAWVEVGSVARGQNEMEEVAVARRKRAARHAFSMCKKMMMMMMTVRFIAGL
jgi:hypothetical protein